MRLLSKSGFVVDATAAIDEASAALKLTSYDAVIVDLAVPDCGEYEMFRLIRQKRPGTRILALLETKANVAKMRISALNSGADDVLATPYVPDELLARVRALLRRPTQVVAATLRFGNIELDTHTGGVKIAGELVCLPRREVLILDMLMRNTSRIMPREKLEQAVFSFDNVVTPNALEAAISRLRRNLIDYGSTLTVISLRRSGYTLAARDDSGVLRNDRFRPLRRVEDQSGVLPLAPVRQPSNLAAGMGLGDESGRVGARETYDV